MGVEPTETLLAHGGKRLKPTESLLAHGGKKLEPTGSLLATLVSDKGPN